MCASTNFIDPVICRGVAVYFEVSNSTVMTVRSRFLFGSAQLCKMTAFTTTVACFVVKRTLLWLVKSAQFPQVFLIGFLGRSRVGSPLGGV